MRPGETSRMVSVLSLLGLILVSIFMVLVLNSGALANPTLPFQNGNPSSGAGPTGTLVVQLSTNQNETDRLANPANHLLPLGEKAMTVTPADNSSSPQVLITDTRGGVLQEMPAGRYILRLVDETLDIMIPVQVSVGNLTKLKVTILETAYPVAYSEESGILLTGGKPQSNMFVQLAANAPVAGLNDQVLLKVHLGGPGVGYLSNATVLAAQPPDGGSQWLQLGSEAAINPVSATSIVLTTWAYSSSVSVSVIPLVVSADD